jgi:hypothetical protein
MSILPNGNVIIQAGGTFTDAGYKLDVNGTGRFNSGTTGGSIIFSAATNYGLIQDANSVSRIWFENTGSYRTLFDLPSAGTSFAFRTSAGTIIASITSAGAATFSSSVMAGGFLANGSTTITSPIDTTSTKAYFDASSISGAALTLRADSVGRTLRITSDGSGTVIGAFDANSSGVNIGANTAHPLLFNTSGTERMRITSGGKGLFGTTTATPASSGLGANSFQVKDELMSMGSLAGVFFENRSGGVTSSSNWGGWYWTGTSTNLYNGSANIAAINMTTGIYTSLSNINAKKDFELSTLGLNAIMGLKPTLYRMKSENNTAKHLGFIAQEVKEFIPQAYVENGEFIGLQDRPIIAAAIKAIQELKTQNDALQSRIETLESK